MMREKFKKTIFQNGECTLEILTNSSDQENSVGHYLLDDGDTIPQEMVTPVLLKMLSEAYYAGYSEAVIDGQIAVNRLLYENNAHRKPAPKISQTFDWRKFREGIK